MKIDGKESGEHFRLEDQYGHRWRIVDREDGLDILLIEPIGGYTNQIKINPINGNHIRLNAEADREA